MAPSSSSSSSRTRLCKHWLVATFFILGRIDDDDDDDDDNDDDMEDISMVGCILVLGLLLLHPTLSATAKSLLSKSSNFN